MDGKVLLLDYSAYERQKIRHILDRTSSLEIIEVGEIRQFKLLSLDIPDLKLVIMNLSFPTEIDGLNTLRKIHESKGRNTPVIIIAQTDKPELRTEALKHSVRDYLVKPYQVKRLEASISGIIKTEAKFHYSTEEISDINMSFEAYAEREIKYSARTGTPLSMILITTLQMDQRARTGVRMTDSYKASVFAIAAKRAKEALRKTDTIVLNSDRDIIIVLPCTEENGARLVCEKIVKLTAPEINKMSLNLNEHIYPVYVTYPKDGDNFQALMKTAFRKVSDKEMLEKIVSIPEKARKYADRSYNKYKRWL